MKTLPLPETVLFVGISVFVAFITPLRAQPGSLDPTFNPTFNRQPTGSGVSALAAQTDNKLVVGGNFQTVNGVRRVALLRLLPNGTLDPDFQQRNPDGSDVFSSVSSLAMTDGDCVVAGGTLSGSGAYGVARFNSDGTRDASYDPATDPNPFAVRQSDGKALIVDGGLRIKRLNPDGSPDSSFSSIQLGGGIPMPPFDSSNITAIAVQSNNKIIVATLFLRSIGTEWRVFRLESDGNLDRGFTPAKASSDIFAIAVQHDGGIVIAGQFYTVNGVPRNGLARLIGENPADKPLITAQPVDRTAAVGVSVVFSVAVNSLEAPTFQWQFNGSDIPGATNRILEFVGVQLGQAGEYNVVVRNSLGSAESAIARLVVLASGCPAPSFAAARPVEAGLNPGWGTSDDFNGDGKADLAVVNTSSGTVSVLLGTGDGGFQPPIAYGTGTNPFSVAAGDFNGDGRADLTVGNVSVLLGSGDGTFQPAVNYATGGRQPVSVAVGDFNGDGKPDLALAVSNNGLNPYVSVLLNKDGAFQNATNYSTGALIDFRYSAGNYSLAVGDLNSDGKPDLVVTIPGDRSNQKPLAGSVFVLLGNGDGSFRAAPTRYLDEFPYSVAIADFNADGKPDLAVAAYGSILQIDLNPGVSVFLGNGDGSFQSVSYYGAGPQPGFVVAADFNGDGLPDLALANHGGNPPDFLDGSVSVLLGKGDGRFEAAVNFPAAGGPSFMAVGDFNGDHNPDLVVTTGSLLSGSPRICFVLLSTCNSDGGCTTPGFAAASTIEGGPYPTSVAVGDCNGDGKLDLAVAYPDRSVNGQVMPGSVSVLLGKGNGTFGPAIRTADRAGNALAFGDFNGDGKADLAVAKGVGRSTVSVLFGRGDGTFQFGADYPLGLLAVSVAVGEFNADGHTDLCVVNQIAPDHVSVLLNKGDGTFQAAVSYITGLFPGSVAVADLNRDGKPDLIVTSLGAFDPAWGYIHSGVSVLLGRGDGRFETALNSDAGSNPSSLAVGDFNGDGRPDVAVTISGGVVLLLGKGDGAFQPPINVATRIGGPLAVGDFNGDGKLDLVMADGVGSVLLGKGDGSFAAPVSLCGVAGAVSVVVGDFNTDGRPDILVNTATGNLAVLLNTSSPSNIGLSALRLNNAVTISWPLASTGAVLESTTSLSLTNWQPAVEALTTNNGRLEVTAPLDQSQRFFRLRKL